jgi:hypothetical protein
VVVDLFFTHASNGATFTDVDRQHLYMDGAVRSGQRAAAEVLAEL